MTKISVHLDEKVERLIGTINLLIDNGFIVVSKNSFTGFTENISFLKASLILLDDTAYIVDEKNEQQRLVLVPLELSSEPQKFTILSEIFDPIKIEKLNRTVSITILDQKETSYCNHSDNKL